PHYSRTSSQPAAMAEAATAAATPLLPGLLDDVFIWEILVRLDPKSLLRCRAVRRAWRRATSTRRFLLAHHARQPAFPIADGDQLVLGVHLHDILAFDLRAAAKAHLHTVARLDQDFYLEASCDGLLVLSTFAKGGSGCCISICNPVTREHASLAGPPWDFTAFGMYLHRPTGEYRLLLQRGSNRDSPEEQIDCYVFPLGSDQPPRYIGWPDMESVVFNLPIQLRDNLHWYPYYHLSESEQLQSEGKPVIVFDTVAESFRQMHAPIVPTKSYLFEMDDTIGIYCNDGDKNTVSIWVLQNYESEVWDLKYRIRLPVEEIRGQFEGCNDYRDVNLWDVDVVSGDGGVLLLVSFGRWVLHIDTDGKLIDSFYSGLLGLRIYECRLKQSLVQHAFFPALEGYVVNASPFI
uniref:F-box associated beta-propeller type 3 domain-containing protein n=2 Tax=Aegilops tauschii subsp. strangulata TaxID=200361 RepID=A0A453GIQ2_AEGTS